jgi:pyridoxal phosphate enzyme (YggS family)
MSIADRVAEVRGRIAEAAQRSGRRASDVTLIAVSKYVGMEAIRELLAAGCLDLGESRPQDLWKKSEVLGGEPVRWHLVGHLQSNKVRRTLPIVSLIHSVDSEKLLGFIEAEAAALNRAVPVLLEVNTSGDIAKHGFADDSVRGIVDRAANWPHVTIAGLMTMAALEGGLEAARRNFASLRELRDRLREVAPPQVTLDQLSMGMSDDYEAAIREGATMVRIGSALFEQSV